VDLVVRGIKPSQIIDAQAMDNAIRVLHALGGSTNAVVHLLSIAGRLGLPLSLDRFDELSETTPWLVNVRPSGEYLMEEFFEAGGVPGVMGELGSLINREAATVTGKTIGENIGEARSLNPDVIATTAEPLAPDGALVVLRGNLAPRGALMKRSAADPRLLRHEGRAVVLESQEVGSRLDDPDLPVDADTVLIMRGAGPVGGPGMPEAGHLPIPKKLLEAGVNDLVRISDARVSGTAFGALVVHVSPESAVGGPLALVRDGDLIRLDVDERSLDLMVDGNELDRRRSELPQAEFGKERGWLGLYRRHVLQADEGCDLDFLRGSTPTDTASEWMLWADDYP
jgi:dihydroxy-acid dehydratase